MKRNHCLRCGQCCLKSSPTLLYADLDLVAKGPISPGDLYTIRRGELVFNNIEEKIEINDLEMIKLREKDTGGCIYYDQSRQGCRIYQYRPSQCAALKCWDRSDFDRVFSSSKLERKDIVYDPVLKGLIEEHDKRCGYRELERLVRRIEADGEKALEEILTRLRFDFQIRPFVAEKLKIGPDHMDLFFGRDLTRTIHMFGLEVRKDPDGSFLLTVADRGRV